MKTIFRIDLAEALRNGSPVEVELGCGMANPPGRIKIDRVDLPHLDIVTDLEDGLSFFPDNSVDAIHSKSVLEHIHNFDFLMRETWRILKPAGTQNIFVPHFSNPFYYSDPTHVRFFGLYSFEYYSAGHFYFSRKLPAYYQEYGFLIQHISLVFGSPWRGRNFVKRLMQKIVNINSWMMEFYEENLCYAFPCYGLQVTLKPIKAEEKGTR
jgi:SAM-dependent methyltransferase